ncbi:hypothetical protein [Nocardia sp. XZ_19_369]|uniref:hypothetical protein n=1 Tax=Nocardia sp. XZ_19_369 TaxID=2769487 RepID=UPI00188E90B3|nr:hypothetical protein [Nocardia sp. XZ_19_369]
MKWIRPDEDWKPARGIEAGYVLLATASAYQITPVWVRQYVARIVPLPLEQVCFVAGNDDLWMLPEGSVVTGFSVPLPDRHLLREETPHVEAELSAEMRGFLTGLVVRGAVVVASFQGAMADLCRDRLLTASIDNPARWLVRATSTGNRHITMTVDGRPDGGVKVEQAVVWLGARHHPDNERRLDLPATAGRHELLDADQLAEIVLRSVSEISVSARHEECW